MISSPYIVLSYNKKHEHYIAAAITRQESAALFRNFQFVIVLLVSMRPLHDALWGLWAPGIRGK